MSKQAIKSFQQIWKHMDSDRRRQATEAFFASADSASEQKRAAGVIATKYNLRPQKAAKLPAETTAKYLASIDAIDELMAATLVRTYLFTRQVPMLSSFLDELGIAHKEGVISAETVTAPSAGALRTSVEKIRSAFDPADVQIYLSALSASDPVTWANLEEATAAQSQ